MTNQEDHHNTSEIQKGGNDSLASSDGTFESKSLQDNATNGSDIENVNPTAKTGFNLRWNRITKEVVVTETTSGLLRGSIANPTKETNDAINKTCPTKKVILDDVSGYAIPGEVMALMGPSGSGKTSLLNVLSGRSQHNDGDITVDGVKAKGGVMKRLKRKIAYVKQNDVFFGHLTVRDQLTYTALLRLPSSTSKMEKHAEVDRILHILRLEKCADTPINFISGGERKRVNIGTEMLTDPAVIMLDEPTSGLDSTSAVALMSTLHGLAKENGKTIITSIHQPSSAVFQSFDRLMLLADGHVVYFGTPADSLSYLNRLTLDCPDGYNAADHWMDLLVVDSALVGDSDNDAMAKAMEKASETNTTDVSCDDKMVKKDKYGIPMNARGKNLRTLLIESWDSDALARDIDAMNKNDGTLSDSGASDGDGDDILQSFGQKYNSTWMTQVFILMHRAMKNSRSAIFTPLNIIKSGCIGIMMGLLWFQMPYTERTVTDRVSYYFFTMTYWVFDAMFTAFMSFPTERDVIFKERASGCYHLSAYFIAKTASEAPTRLALPCIYMITSYWLAGINNNFAVFVNSTLCTLLCVLAGESAGLLVGATIMDMEKGMTVMTVTSLSLMVVGGFFVQNIPIFISWIKYLSAFKYAFDASQQLVFDKPVPCDGSGVLEMCDGGSTGAVSPQEMTEFLGAQGSIGFNVGMLLVLFIIPRIIAYMALKRQKGGERT